VLSQKGNLKKVTEALSLPDLAKAILSLRLGILFSHSRIDLSNELVGVRIRHKIEIDIPATMLRKHPTLAHWLQKEQVAWSEVDWSMAVRQY
jgi:exopolyphosphatase/guanosine-5'-triphosphate,3'-diphosphate pyrophosphatase